MSDSGAINVKSALGVCVIAAVAYAGVIFAPGLIDYCRLAQAVRTACNLAQTERSEDALRDRVAHAWQDTDPYETLLNPNGSTIDRPVPFSAGRNVTVELTDDPPQVSVGFHYTQHVALPFLGQERAIHWHYEHTQALEPLTADEGSASE